MFAKDTKIYQKNKKKSWLTIEKNIKYGKMPYFNYKKL